MPFLHIPSRLSGRLHMGRIRIFRPYNMDANNIVLDREVTTYLLLSIIVLCRWFSVLTSCWSGYRLESKNVLFLGNDMNKFLITIGGMIVALGLLCSWNAPAQQYSGSEQAVKCTICNGSGKNAFGKPCPWCNSTGTQWCKTNSIPRQGSDSEQAIKCTICNGTGKNAFGKPCPWCNSTGTQWRKTNSIPRQGSGDEQAVKCTICNGTGKNAFGKPCPWCNSTGTQWRKPVNK